MMSLCVRVCWFMYSVCGVTTILECFTSAGKSCTVFGTFNLTPTTMGLIRLAKSFLLKKCGSRSHSKNIQTQCKGDQKFFKTTHYGNAKAKNNGNVKPMKNEAAMRRERTVSHSLALELHEAAKEKAKGQGKCKKLVVDKEPNEHGSSLIVLMDKEPNEHGVTVWFPNASDCGKDFRPEDLHRCHDDLLKATISGDSDLPSGGGPILPTPKFAQKPTGPQPRFKAPPLPKEPRKLELFLI